MHGCISRQIDIVFKNGVTAEEGAIGENTVIADHAIVGDVAVGHEEVVVSDAGAAVTAAGADVDGDAFTEDISVSDFEAGGLVVVFFILRRVADDGVGVEVVFGADFSSADDDDVAEEAAAGGDFDLGPDAAEGSDFDILGNFCPRIDATEGGNLGHRGKAKSARHPPT